MNKLKLAWIYHSLQIFILKYRMSLLCLTVCIPEFGISSSPARVFLNITTFCFYFFVISPRLCNNCLSLQFTLTSEILTRSRVSLSPRSPHQVINCSGCRADGAGLKHNVKYLCTFHRKRFVSRVIKCQDALTRPTGYFFAMSKCIFYLIIFKNVISSKSK